MVDVTDIKLSINGDSLLASVTLANGAGGPNNGYAVWSRSTDHVHAEFEVIPSATGAMSYGPTWRDVGHSVRFTFMPFGEGSKGAHIQTPALAGKPGPDADKALPVPTSSKEVLAASQARLPVKKTDAELRIEHKRKIKAAKQKMKKPPTLTNCMFTPGKTKQPSFIRENERIEMDYRALLTQCEVYRDVTLLPKAPEPDAPKQIEYRTDPDTGELVYYSYKKKTLTEYPEAAIPTGFKPKNNNLSSMFAPSHEYEPQYAAIVNAQKAKSPGPGTYRKNVMDVEEPREQYVFSRATGHDSFYNFDADIPSPSTYGQVVVSTEKKDDGTMSRLPHNCEGLGCTKSHKEVLRSGKECRDLAYHEGQFYAGEY